MEDGAEQVRVGGWDRGGGGWGGRGYLRVGGSCNEGENQGAEGENDACTMGSM